MSESITPEEPTDLASIEKEGEALREKLVAETEAANAGAPAPEPVKAEAETPEPEAEAATETSSEKDISISDKTRDEKGRFVKQEAKPEQAAAPEQPKDDSKYSKAKKDAERKDRSWKKLEEDKAEFQRQREEYEAQRQAYARQIQEQQRQAQKQQQSDITRFSPEEFERAAEWHEAKALEAVQNGDLDEHNKHINDAKIMRKAAKQSAQQQTEARQQQAQSDFTAQYEASFERACKENPELANPDTEIGKKMLAILQSEPVFQMLPNGFEKAYQLLQLRDKASGYDDAIARAEKAEAEIERLTKLSQPGAGAPAAPVSPEVDADNMPLDQLGKLVQQRVYSGGSLLR